MWKLFMKRGETHEKSQSVNAVSYQLGTLGGSIEDFCQRPTKGDTHERGLANWYRVLQLNPGQRLSFEATLSGHQQKSLHVIGEWWEETYSVGARKRIPEAFIFGRSCVTTKLHGFDPAKNQHFLDQDIGASLYHDALQQLFTLEFIAEDGWKSQKTNNGLMVEDTDKSFLGALYTVRLRALKYASAQRLTWHFLRSPSDVDFRPRSILRHDSPPWLDCSPWLSPEEKLGLPYYLWDIKNEETVETSKLKDPSPRYMCISHTWGRWRKKGSAIKLKGAKWDIPENTRFDVSTLPRLLREAKFELDYVWIDLLCIPQDESDIARQEVARQTCIFGSSIPCAIWFGPDVVDWTPMVMSLGWLSMRYLQSTSWKAGIRIDNDTLAVQHKSLPEPIKGDEFMSQLGQCVNRPNGIYHSEHNNDGKEVWRLPSWFSSLWTLQEICLRPSMFLLDEKMRPLEARDGNLIMLDGLMAFLEVAEKAGEHSTHLNAFLGDYQVVQRWDETQNQNARDVLNSIIWTEFSPEDASKRKKALPYGPAEIFEMARETSVLYDVANGPASILWLADTRECKRSRAIAIMSVLGSTKWYNEFLEGNHANERYTEDVKDLVFGKYPVAFIQEVAHRVGPAFYASMFRQNVKNSPQNLLKLDVQPIGSMLPFANAVANASYGFSPYPLRSLVHVTHGDSHPSVRTWTIQQDGTVHIPSAAVLATQDDLDQGRQFDTWYNMFVWCILLEQPATPLRVLEFPELLPMLPSKMDAIFVVLTEGSGYSSGILLHQISPNVLVKVGNWFTANTKLWTKLIPSQEVNWKVL